MFSKIKTLYTLLIFANLLIWIVAFFSYHHYPISFSLCLLAYVFGLRHGIDADHVAAIDSATRKLMETSETSGLVGFFFSLGHSTIVIILSFLVAISAASIHNHFPKISSYGEIIGTIFSILFLLIFSISNLNICLDVIKKIKTKSVKSETQIKTSGFLSKIFKPIFKVVTKDWHMYFVGFLFGLGFDTATEVALLGMSAYALTQKISIWTIMVFPLLFTAGMALVDTSSGLLVLKAYRWAYTKSSRKLYYNLVITLFSFLTALVIACYEMLNIFAEKSHYTHGGWSYLSNHSEMIGGLLIALLVMFYLFSRMIFRPAIEE